VLLLFGFVITELSVMEQEQRYQAVLEVEAGTPVVEVARGSGCRARRSTGGWPATAAAACRGRAVAASLRRCDSRAMERARSIRAPEPEDNHDRRAAASDARPVRQPLRAASATCLTRHGSDSSCLGRLVHPVHSYCRIAGIGHGGSRSRGVVGVAAVDHNDLVPRHFGGLSAAARPTMFRSSSPK
jgi:hypothetical protein